MIRKKYFVTLVILAASVLAILGLNAFKPKAKRIKPALPVPIIKAIELFPQDEHVYIEAYGSVIPAREIDLYPEVAGRIIKQSPELVPGGIIGKDQFIAQIDPIDYELKLKEYEAEVAEAEYGLEFEKGQQNIAKKEWQLFGKEAASTQASKSLALREPHMKNARAKLDAASSKLAAARLALQRTTMRSPFNALVLEESVEEGQLVGLQKPIAKLVDTDNFWIQVSIALSSLERVHFPGRYKKEGSNARVVLDAGNGHTVNRNGKVFKLLGDLDPKGKMVRLLVLLRDPLKLKDETGNRAGNGKILLGSYVKVNIDAGVFKDIYVIPREAIRDGNKIWTLDDAGKLVIKQVTIKWRRQDDVLVEADIEPGERLVTSRIQAPLPGMQLRTKAEAQPPRKDMEPR